MKELKVKKRFVSIDFRKFIEVTENAPEIYKIIIVFAKAGGLFFEDGCAEFFYQGFRSEDDARRYCTECSEKYDFVRVSYEFVVKVNFGGNDNE